MKRVTLFEYKLINNKKTVKTWHDKIRENTVVVIMIRYATATF